MKLVNYIICIILAHICTFNAYAQENKRIYFDAEAFDLKGHVKVCGNNKFSIDGALFIPQHEYERIEREGNRISRIVYEDTPSAEVYTEFCWENGRVVMSSYSAVSSYTDEFGTNLSSEYNIREYKYNTSGYIIEMTESNGKALSWTYRYEYIEFDNHGNWTKRRRITVIEDYDRNIEIETRNIIYY